MPQCRRPLYRASPDFPRRSAAAPFRGIIINVSAVMFSFLGVPNVRPGPGGTTFLSDDTFNPGVIYCPFCLKPLTWMKSIAFFVLQAFVFRASLSLEDTPSFFIGTARENSLAVLCKAAVLRKIRMLARAVICCFFSSPSFVRQSPATELFNLKEL